MIRMHFLSIRLAHRGTMVKMLESTAAPNAPGLMIKVNQSRQVCGYFKFWNFLALNSTALSQKNESKKFSVFV